MFSISRDYDYLSKSLGYEFNNIDLLLQALTRTSALNEGIQKPSIGSFQTLEFLGDKVLNLIVSDIVKEANPTWQEGNLTREVAKFVNNSGPLAQVARNLELGGYIIMGRGEALNNQARTNEKVLSDAVEALIGAMWVDSGRDYQKLKQFISVHWRTLGLQEVPSTYTLEASDISKELDAIFIDLNDEAEILAAFRQWLGQQHTSASLVTAAYNYLLASHTLERPECLKLLLNKHLLSQQNIDDMLVTSFDFYESSYDGKYANEKLDSIELLLEYGANPNTASYKGLCLLIAAIVYHCEKESIKLLLKNGANVHLTPSQSIIKNISLKPTSSQRLKIFKPAQPKLNLNTALHSVAEIYLFDDTNLEHAKLLIKYGANPNFPNHEGKIPLHIVCETLATFAVDPMPKAFFIDDLLESQANLDWQDRQGNTPLHL
jgi:dsRNA-specific ribonuclease